MRISDMQQQQQDSSMIIRVYYLLNISINIRMLSIIGQIIGQCISSNFVTTSPIYKFQIQLAQLL